MFIPSRGCSHGIFSQYIKCLCKLIFLVTLHKKCCAWWLNYLLRILKYLCCQDGHPDPAGRVPAAARVRSQGALHGRARPGQVRANENTASGHVAPYSSLIGQVWSGRRRGERGRGEADHGQAAGRRQHPAGAAVRAAQVELCNFDIDIGYTLSLEIDTCPLSDSLDKGTCFNTCLAKLLNRFLKCERCFQQTASISHYEGPSVYLIDVKLK